MSLAATGASPVKLGSADSGFASDKDSSTRRMTPGPRKQPRRTIRFRLACLVLACVLPVWLAAGFLVYYSYQHKRRALQETVLETARALSLVVDRELANMQASLTALATSPSLATGDLAAFHRQARLILPDYPGGDIILANATGQQLVNSFVPFGKPLPRRNIPDTVRGVYATGKPIISNVFKGAVTGRFLLSVDVPVFRDERVVYDLALTIPAERLMTVLSQQRIPSAWTAAIVDRNDVVAARNRFPDRYVGRQVSPVLSRHLTEAVEGSADTINLEGTEVMAIFNRSTKTGWTVVIGIPKAVFVSDIWRGLRWAVCAIVLLSIAVISLALFLARRIAGSIQALIAPALALGSGGPVDIGQLDLAETNQVGQSLLLASELLQQRAAERERAEAVRRQAEELERSNAEFRRREADARAHAAEVSAILEELRASEERLRLLGDNLPNSIVYQYTHEPDGTPRFLYISAGVERLNGVKPKDVLKDAGVLHRQFLPGELPALLEAERVSARDLSTFEREAQMRLPDGQLRWMHLLSRPRRLPDGRVIWDGVQTDITDHKQAEQALIRSEKLASAGRMAATVAHEINNPLEAIGNAVYLAWMDKSISKEAKANLDIAVHELQRVAHLAQRTLGFYRDHATPALIDLRGTVDGVVDLFVPRLKTRGIAIEKRYAQVEAIKAVDGELRQIVSNLVSNSLDAMEKDGRILLRINPFSADGRRSVRLTIADTGTGIAPERLSKIFEPFFTTKESVGTGLGLWVTKELVQKYGGTIRVRSKVGKGTVFSIGFPIKEQSGANAEQVSAAGVAEQSDG